MSYVAKCFVGYKALFILEPSVGDGSFIRAFNKSEFPKSIQNYSFHAIEKYKSELDKAKEEANRQRKKNVKFSFFKNDFLKYQSTKNRKFSLVIGNPPYIKKSLLNKTQVEFCKKIQISIGLEDKSVNNIWPYFLLRNCQLLTDEGILAFVLPAELLQVNFSVELRQYLVDNFARTEIFTFDDLLFECKGQDTVLLVAYKKHKSKGQYFTHITDVDQLVTKKFILAENKALETSEIKWTHHALAADELNFIHNIGSRLKCINTFCESRPGIVTAANKFFIVNEAIEKQFNLTDFVQPIIQKGFYVNGSIVFDQKEFDKLVVEGKPTKVLTISDNEAKSLPDSVNEYIKIGNIQKIPIGYKCSKRTNWFVIPNIAEASDGFFFRRIHHYPKILKNEAKVLVTDSAYKIEMREDYTIESLIFSFYNSLSLAFAELGGRYYGGGVLELTPTEFKNIPIPYESISDSNFKIFRKEFENKKEIKEILFLNDRKILNSSLGLGDEDIDKIQSILDKLVSKRFRK